MDDGTPVNEGIQRPRWWASMLAILLVASIAMASVAAVVQVADFDVDTRVGIVDFQLDTDWQAGKVTYSGSASEFGVDVADEQVLLQGTGDFQEAVGFLKGTAKRVTNAITPYTTDFLGTRATLNVTTTTETIPWWVVGVSTRCAVEVELIQSMNVSRLTIDRVYMEFRRVVDGETVKRVVWSKEVSDALSQVGARRTYEADLEVNEDWGEFAVFGMVNVTMVDSNGITATRVYRSYSTEPKVITIWTIPTVDGVRIGLLIAALPVYVLGMVFAGAGAVTILLGRRGSMVLPVAATVLLLLGALFFMLGVTQLADLVGYPDDLSFAPGFYLMLLAFMPAMVVGILLVYGRYAFGTAGEETADGYCEGEATDPYEGEEAPSAENDNNHETNLEEEGPG